MNNNQKATKRALLTSVMALVMCVVMLVGTTFAWFTDTASTGVNKIQAGNLDVQLLDATTGNSIEGETLQFKKAAGATQGEQVLWEPGCTYELPAFIVKNNGSLNLKYKIVISGIKGSAKLNEAIEWTMTEGGTSVNINDGTEVPLAPNATSGDIIIKGHMKENAGNEYQGLSIDGIAITVYAAQVSAEFDSIGNTYDQYAEYPLHIVPAVVEQPLAAVKDSGDNVTAYEYANSDNTFKVSVPAAAVAGGTSAPVVTAKKTETPANITIDAAQQDSISYDISVTSDGAGVSASAPATVTLNIGAGLTGVKLYHNNTLMTLDSDGTLVAGEYKYDAVAGTVTFMTDSFSPFTVVVDAPAAIVGDVRYYDLQKALDVGGVVTLLRDVKIDATKTTVADRLTVNAPTTLNFNDKKLIAPGELEPTSNWAALYIKANTTINADENGGIQCLNKENGECGPYAINVIGGANVTINGGTYYGGGTAVQVQLGTLTVNGGVYDGTSFGEKYGYKFLLNCVDDNYKNGTAQIVVNGGKFHNYDPANAPCENPIADFVADGKGTVKNGDWYEVISGTFVSTEAELTAALAGTDSTIYLTKDIALTAPITIERNCTLIGNGSATISKQPVNVAPTANVTFKNVNFATPDNDNDNASSVYASGLEGKVVFDGCTFTNPQWECIQITPMDGAEIIATNCKFVVDGKGIYAKENGTKVERLFHIQNTDDTGMYKATITNNQFIGVDLCRNAVIDVDDIEAFANVTCGGNIFYNHDNTSVDTLADGMIYVNINGKYDAANVATDTFAQFTQTPAAALHS